MPSEEMPGSPDRFHRLVILHLAESARVKRAMAGRALHPEPGAAIAASAPLTTNPGHPEGVLASGRAVDAMVTAAEAIADSFRNGGKLLLCGNGGSAADCQHLATEFTNILDKRFRRDPLPALALTTDTSFLTAFANDYQMFEEMFSRQIKALGKRGDALMAISTSGSSPNILHAVGTARTMGIRTIALAGAGGSLAGMADMAIAVPSTRTAYIQEAHLAIEHIICDLVERMLFPARGGGTPEASSEQTSSDLA